MVVWTVDVISGLFTVVNRSSQDRRSWNDLRDPMLVENGSWCAKRDQ